MECRIACLACRPNCLSKKLVAGLSIPDAAPSKSNHQSTTLSVRLIRPDFGSNVEDPKRMRSTP